MPSARKRKSPKGQSGSGSKRRRSRKPTEATPRNLEQEAINLEGRQSVILAASPDVVISVSGQGPDDLISTTRSQTMNPNPDVVVFYICPMGPQEAEPPRHSGDEIIRALARDRNQHNVWGRGYSDPDIAVISGFLTEESPKSLIKPTVQERQPKKQQSSSLAKKQIRQAVPKKRRRSSVSRETPHTLMREILERGSPFEKLEPQKKVMHPDMEQPPHSILKKPTRKFPSPHVSLTELGLRKSSRRSVSFRDEQLNVSLADLNMSVTSESDRSAQWLPNRQGLLTTEISNVTVDMSYVPNDMPPLEREIVIGSENIAETDENIDLGLGSVGTEQRHSGFEMADHDEVNGNNNDDVEEEEEEEEVEEEVGQAARVLPKRSVRQRKKPTPLSRTLVKDLLMHFSKRRVTNDALDMAVELVDKFYDQLIDDLETYCLHAKRKTIEKADFELHLHRIRAINDKKSLDALILEHLPAEYWAELLPIPLKKR